jgi:hypothetical protein
MVSDESANAARACGICSIIARIESGAFADLVAELPRSEGDSLKNARMTLVEVRPEVIDGPG